VEHATFLTESSVEYDQAAVDQMAAAGTVVSATESWLPSDVPFPPVAAGRLETVWGNFVRLHAAGVRMAISSDAGVGPRKPHDVLPHGAIMFGALGLGSGAALTAVTAVPAAACGLEQRKARLAAGFDADLLIVEGDPLKDLRALLRPRVVVRAGRVVWQRGATTDGR
jgi:imidazolonepropionase-like amidohydrolase